MNYRNAMRAQRRGNNGTAAKDAMRGLAGLCMLAAGCFWMPIQWQLVKPVTIGEYFIAISGGMFLIAAPPVLTSFLIPWTPSGMLLNKLKWRTYGQAVVLVASLYLLYYSWMLLLSWWSARLTTDDPATDLSSLVRDQAIIGIIAYILVPALLWTPVSSEELAEELKQAQRVRRYEIETAADIAILQNTLLRAQQKAAVGFANLTVGEREELAQVMRGLIVGIDQTIQEIAGNLSQAAGVTMEFRSPMDSDDVPQLLDYVASELRNGRMASTGHDDYVTPETPSPRHDLARPGGPNRDEERAQPSRAITEASGNSSFGASQRAKVITPSITPATMPHDATRCHTMPHDELYAIARRGLGEVWTVRDLAQVLRVEEPTAREYRAAWVNAGGATNQGLPNGRYRFIDIMKDEEGRP